MPTFYTSEVANGSIDSVRDYALKCARAMMALVTIKGFPNDYPIPKNITENNFYINKVEEAKKLLNEILNLTDAECAIRCHEEFNKKISDRENLIKVSKDIKHKYDQMEKKVKEWNCKAPGLKEFMLNQLTESSFDYYYPCDVFPEYEEKNIKIWREDILEKIKQDIKYYTKEHERELLRTEARNSWLKLFWDSLPD